MNNARRTFSAIAGTLFIFGSVAGLLTTALGILYYVSGGFITSTILSPVTHLAGTGTGFAVCLILASLSIITMFLYATKPWSRSSKYSFDVIGDFENLVSTNEKKAGSKAFVHK